jgi:ankyrin repeat protein
MNKRPSIEDPADRAAKRHKGSSKDEINCEQFLAKYGPLLPRELVANEVLSYCPIEWVFVSKQTSNLAHKFLLSDPRFIEDVKRIFKMSLLAHNIRILEMILDNPTTKPEILPEEVALYVMLLSDQADFDIIKLLLRHNLVPLTLSNGTSIFKHILLNCAQLNQCEVIDLIMKHPDNQDQELLAVEAIPRASKYGQLEAFKLLYQSLADTANQRHLISTTMAQACTLGYKHIVEHLVPQAANVDITQGLQLAVQHKHNEIAVMMLDYERRINNAEACSSVLVTAATHGNFALIPLLLATPAVDPTINDNEPIRMASMKGSFHAVRILLNDKRVDPTALHNSPIRWAAIEGHKDIVTLLLQDSRIDPTDKDNAALHMAVKNRHESVVLELLKSPKFSAAVVKEIQMQAKRLNWSAVVSATEKYLASVTK